MAKPPTKNDVIKKYLYNDLDRFLKRLYRHNKHQLIFSQTLPAYEKQSKGLVKQIAKELKGEYPGNVCYIINVHRVMVKYYNFEIDIEDILLSRRISQVMQTTFDEYHVRQYRRKIKELGLSPKFIRPKKAYKELIARGFIHINDFEGYDKDMGHITSNENLNLNYGKLYYPKNFSWDSWSKNYTINTGHKWWDFTDVYLVHGVIGVSGYTRVSTPGNR